MSLVQFVNQNSYGISAAILAAWVGYDALRRRTPRSLLLFAALAGILVVPPLWLRSAQGGLVELDSALASGRPTLLEVYSDL